MPEQYFEEDPNRQENEVIEVGLLQREQNAETTEVNIEDLAHAVSLWLNYQTTVSSSINLLHEASFRYPVAEYLERKAHSIAKLEEEHPIFENRPTDFQWKQNEKNYYLECKYVKYGYTNKVQEFQRYIDDICRLYYCIQNEDVDICYLLVCGTKEDVEKCFVKSESRLEGEPNAIEHSERNVNKTRYNYIFDFNIGTAKELTFNSQSIEERDGMDSKQKLQMFINKAYRKFIENYMPNIPAAKNNNQIFDDIISLKLLNKHVAKDDDIQCVYIWQVQKGKIEKMDNQPIIAD